MKIMDRGELSTDRCGAPKAINFEVAQTTIKFKRVIGCVIKMKLNEVGFKISNVSVSFIF